MNSYVDFANEAIRLGRERARFVRRLPTLLMIADLAGRADVLEADRPKKKKKLAGTVREMNVPYDEALDHLKSLVPVTAEEFADLEGRYRSLVFGTMTTSGLADSVQYAILNKAKASITSALEDGKTFRDFYQDVGSISNLTKSQLELIFDMNLTNAYASGAWTQIYSSGEADEEYLIWETAGDELVDDVCSVHDGFVAPASDAVWSKLWNPLHFRCRCVVRVAFPSEIEKFNRKPFAPKLSEIPDEFATWPGDGFPLAVPPDQAIADLEAALKNLALPAPPPAESVVENVPIPEPEPWKAPQVDYTKQSFRQENSAMSRSYEKSLDLKLMFQRAGDEWRVKTMMMYSRSFDSILNDYLRGEITARTATQRLRAKIIEIATNTGMGGSTINYGELVFGTKDQTKWNIEDFAKKVQSTIDLVPNEYVYNDTIWRGVKFKTLQKANEFYDNLISNQTVEVKGLISASSRQSVALGFSGVGSQQGVLLEIRNPRGTPIERMSAFQGEAEVILPDGSRFKVIGYDYDPKLKKRVVILERIS